MNLLQKKQLIFFIGITLNAIANAFLFKASLASTAWGIAAMNLATTLNITPGFTISIIGCVLFVVCRVIENKKPTLYSFVGLAGSFVFGFYIDFFLNIISILPVSPTLNILYMVFGIILLAFSIAIYLKANYIVLPIDETLKVVSDRFFSGNMAKGGYLIFTIAIMIALVSGFFINHDLKGFSLYSIIIFFAFSPIINYFSKSTKKLSQFLELDNL